MQQTPNRHNPRNTGSKLVEAGKATRFKKGADPRRNLKGRPKSFDEVRALAQEISHETQNGKLAVERVLRRWMDSPEPALQKAFIEYAFGKVPDKLETTGLENKPVVFLHYAHERQNSSQN